MLEYQALDKEGSVLMNIAGITMAGARERVLENKPTYGNSHVMRSWKDSDYALRTANSGTTLYYDAKQDMYVGERLYPKDITAQEIRGYFRVAKRMEKGTLSLSDWNDGNSNVEITWHIGGVADRAWMSEDEAVERLLVTFNP